MTIAEDLLKYQHKINTRREANLGREDHPKQIILRLLDVNLDESGLPCVDPKSLALFSYMKLCEVTYPTLMFTWECAEGNSRDLPDVYFEDDHETIYSIEHLKTTIYSLEKLRGIPPRSEIQNILRAVGDIEKACFYGLFKCLQPSESPWMSRLITTPEDMLKLQMEDACNYLSDMYKNKPSPSCLDARLFGAAIVVYKCFGCIGNDNDYFSNVYNALRRHLNLRAYLERLHAQLILSLSYNPINYDANMIQDPSFVTTWFVRKENLFQVQNKTLFKSANNIYAFSCGDANPLHLPRGDYIIKESSDHMRGTFESEINVHRRLLHRSFIRPVGHGWLMARCEDGHNKAKGFIVLPLKKKGSLQSNLEGLDWPNALKLSWQIAYSVHPAHTSSLVLCDLKPDNILIDDDGSALMCDFGSVQNTFTEVGKGTRTYNDGSKEAHPAYDIYSYGMVIFAILTEYVKLESNDSLQTILKKIEDGEDIIREKFKNSGCNGPQADSIIGLALDCTEKEASIRPSALDILKDWMQSQNLTRLKQHRVRKTACMGCPKLKQTMESRYYSQEGMTLLLISEI